MLKDEFWKIFFLSLCEFCEILNYKILNSIFIIVRHEDQLHESSLTFSFIFECDINIFFFK